MFAVLSASLLLAMPQESAEKPSPKPIKMGSIRNLSSTGSLYLAGQPEREDLRTLAGKGVKRVINLRSVGEVKWDEPKAVKEAGMEYISIPIRGMISIEKFERVRKLLSEGTPTLLHCGSAVRVGAVWLPFRVLDQGVDLETAVKESAVVGLPKNVYFDQAMAYIKASGKEKSVKPGINDSFLDPELDVEAMVERFELESREIAAARDAVVAAFDPRRGQEIADIGAGTGLFLEPFAEAVGLAGRVYAVDLAPPFIAHLGARAQAAGLDQVWPILCMEDAVGLPEASIDAAFVCDTYHHFEYPRSTSESIHRALRPGGELFVIDFERIEGVTRPWLMEHVRAGKDVVIAELESYGFELLEELEIEGLTENYALRFRRR